MFNIFKNNRNLKNTGARVESDKTFVACIYIGMAKQISTPNPADPRNNIQMPTQLLYFWKCINKTYVYFIVGPNDTIAAFDLIVLVNNALNYLERTDCAIFTNRIFIFH